MSKSKFKKLIKSRVRSAAFANLLEDKDTKSKVKNIKYKNFNLQKYITSKLFSNYEVELLNKLRSRNLNIKSNFKKGNEQDNILNLQCSIKNCFEIEDQEHILYCKPVINSINKQQREQIEKIDYEYIFSSTKKQLEAIKVFILLLDKRDEMLKVQQ